MRTTVTLDEDVERLLRDAMHRSRAGFKQTLNAAIRAGLSRKTTPAKRAPFVLRARPLGLRPGLDPGGLNQLTDELEVAAFLSKSPETQGGVIIPDLNLLLYAYDAGSPFHPRAAAWWRGCLSGTETVGLLPVVAFGFVRLGTHPRVFEKPMTPAEAAGHIRDWLEQPPVEWLDPGPRHVESVLRLLEGLGTAGNLVTDAQIAAATLNHDAVLHTTDADFIRFGDLRWFNPLTGMSSPRRRP